MIILLQGVTAQSRRLFWHISYYKVRQNNFSTKCGRLFLQSASSIEKCERLLLQSVPGITKCDWLYWKGLHVLQNVTIIIKWDGIQQIMMQSSKRNRLAVSKLIWGIWQILTRVLENRKNSGFILEIKMAGKLYKINKCNK